MRQRNGITIHELELALDAANKNNAHLQDSSRQQTTKILELTSSLEESNRKMHTALEQYTVISDKLQLVERDCNNFRINLDQALNAKKISETKVVELTSRLTEITNINVNLSQKVAIIEKELSALHADYTTTANELKIAEDRHDKVVQEAQYVESLLKDEQVKVNRAENAKKALESQVRSLTISMEEIECNSISTSRRSIQKLESRIEELEILLHDERKMHVETSTTLQKREKSFKELMLQYEEDRKNIVIFQESLNHLNEKIKMYRRQLEEQEAISNTNIMRVKKLQRELEASEDRANEAESSLNAFRSRQRVLAAAEISRESVSDEVEREVVIKKVVHNIHSSNVGSSSYSSSTRNEASALSSSSQQVGASSSSYQLGTSSAQRVGATSSYSRAASMASRASMSRALSVGRSSSVLKY